MENFYLLYERFDYKFSFRCHNIFKCKYNKNRAVICDIDSELQYFDDETNSYKNTKKILLIPFTTDIDRMGILQVFIKGFKDDIFTYLENENTDCNITFFDKECSGIGIGLIFDNELRMKNNDYDLKVFRNLYNELFVR